MVSTMELLNGTARLVHPFMSPSSAGSTGSTGSQIVQTSVGI